MFIILACLFLDQLFYYALFSAVIYLKTVCVVLLALLIVAVSSKDLRDRGQRMRGKLGMLESKFMKRSP